MNGPHPLGYWSQHLSGSTFADMAIGQRYEVIRSFIDFDDDVHSPGECWIFLGAGPFPYDDGHSLFVSLDGQREWQIRLQWRPEEQAEILEMWHSYVACIGE